MPTALMQHLEVPDLGDVAGSSDAELMEAMRAWAHARRVVDAGLASLAGEVARRSSLELGYDGLAQRIGARTADALVSQVTGTTGAEARAITAVGAMMAAPTPWMGEVVTQVSAGQVSVGAAAAIQAGLGSPSPTVAPDDLTDAAHLLLDTLHRESCLGCDLGISQSLDPVREKNLARSRLEPSDSLLEAPKRVAGLEDRHLVEQQVTGSLEHRA